MIRVDPAATIVVMRPAEPGFEVLMVERNSRGFFRDLHVFPGGKVDEEDLTDDEDRSHRLAAMRELAEEAGFIVTAEGAVPAPPLRGSDFYQWIDNESLDPAYDDLTLISRWVTPEGAPRRFDTRFYLARCEDPPPVRIDPEELLGFEWVTPTAALEAYHSGRWSMFLPTVTHLRWLERRTDITDAMSSAEGADGRTLIEPRKVEDGSLLPIHMPTS